MKIRPVSDLHFEFQRDHGVSLMDEIVAEPFDVLVVAGDLSYVRGLYSALKTVCGATKKPVVYVMGNHEAYGGSWRRAYDEANRAFADFSNLYFLENSSMRIEGVLFYGTTLWFPHDGEPAPLDNFMGDFQYISDIYDTVLPDKPIRAREFLKAHLEPGSVVVTHHLPSRKSIAPEYEDSALNRYFLHPLESLMVERQPALWIHGHTHASFDYQVNKTRVVCNPFGYAVNQAGEPNPDFDSSLIVEV